MTTALMILTVLSTALITGFMYSYSVSVNPGLHAVSDEVYLRAMQSINRAILNPFFFISFMGTLILQPVNAYANFAHVNRLSSILFIVGAVLYAGVFAVTIFGNVPLNEALANVDLDGTSSTDLQRYRSSFEEPWNRLHFLRTMACLASLVCVAVASVVRGS
jgi:uncharacterized membrane protein